MLNLRNVLSLSYCQIIHNLNHVLSFTLEHISPPAARGQCRHKEHDPDVNSAAISPIEAVNHLYLKSQD